MCSDHNLEKCVQFGRNHIRTEVDAGFLQVNTANRPMAIAFVANSSTYAETLDPACLFDNKILVACNVSECIRTRR